MGRDGILCARMDKNDDGMGFNVAFPIPKPNGGPVTNSSHQAGLEFLYWTFVVDWNSPFKIKPKKKMPRQFLQ